MNQKNNLLLETTNLTKKYNDNLIFKNINLHIKQNEFITILGPSGCGKTTLLKILSGLIKDFTGEINSVAPIHLKRSYSIAFQDSPLFPWLTAIENIIICLNNPAMTKQEKHTIAFNYFKKVDLEGFENYFPDELSGGMIQRINIARCFSTNSEIIFMDEPFVHLDFLQRIALQKITLNIFNEQKPSIFFVTHNIHEAVTLADRILIMSAQPGKIIKEILIDLPRPRDVYGIRNHSQYIFLIKEITETLSIEYNKSQDQYKQWLKKQHIK